MGHTPLQFRILGETVRVEMPEPPERMRLDEMLPALYSLQDGFASAAARRQGQPVSCAKGCAECCRIQPVPVTSVEAYAILLIVERLPEPRQTAVRARFADCAACLAEAGLAENFLAGRRPLSDQQAKAEARQYLNLRLACPFLQGDTCSIYEVRPFACREYYVTSPKHLCTDPLANPVVTVPGILQAATANQVTAAAFLGDAAYTVPLTLALIYAQTHRAALALTYDSNQVVSRSVADLFALAGSQGLLG